MNAAQVYVRNRRKRKPTGQTRTAQLLDATDQINVFGKHVGLIVTDLDTLRDYTAQGSLATDPWRPRGIFNNGSDLTPV